MKRVLLKIAYDGTAYHGFQRQPGQVTIQGEVERAIAEVTGEETELLGGSRTDAGVHSMGNLAVFDTASRMEAGKFAAALNTKLPGDIVIQDACRTRDDFHPLKCSSIKTYEYTIFEHSCEMPLYARYVYYTRRKLDTDAMGAAAVLFEGTHDFTSFCSAGCDKEDKVRTITQSAVATEVDVKTGGRIIRFRVSGNGFLYNMVRIMAGTLMQSGLAQIAPDDIGKIIDGRNRSLAGPTAPAKGLCHIGTEIADWEIER